MSIGVVNYAKEVKGLQIGLINRTKHLRGVQIGVLNSSDDGGLPFIPVVNVGWK